MGVAWGATLYACSKSIIQRNDIKNITVVQLCGGISKIEKNIYASEIPKNISEAYKGAVGDICTRIIDMNGNICDRSLNERTIAIELDHLKQKEYRIGVAIGGNKVSVFMVP